MATETKPFDAAEYLSSPEMRAEYLRAALEDGHEAVIATVLRDIAQANSWPEMRYAVNLTEDDNGTILATVPDIPEAITFGEDQDHALARASDAIETALMGRIAAREDIPAPKAKGAQYVVPSFLKRAKGSDAHETGKREL